MSYIYQIKPLDITPTGVPIVPGATRVTAQSGGYFVAYRLVSRRYVTVAVIYKDYVTGYFLVGAEPAVMVTMPGGQTLQELVELDTTAWGCWLCDTIDTSGPEPALRANHIILSNLIVPSMSTISPVVIGPQLVAIGGKPSAPYALADFDPQEIEAGTLWIGDHHIG